LVIEVMPDIYRIEIPLPNTPLKIMNSYLIRGEERNLLVDTGLNNSQCLEAMRSGLKELGVDLANTDILLTHFHADHSGLIESLKTETSTFYCGKQDSFAFRQGFSEKDYWGDMWHHVLRHGFPESVLESAFVNNPGYEYCSFPCLDYSVLKEGDSLRVGKYSFKCLETPGHTKGHICLYEPEKKLLLVGDHILGNITPNISLAADDGNPLKEYLQSLDKVNTLEVELALPGHRGPINKFSKRIAELKLHYERRCEEVLVALEKGEKTAYQVATEIKWDMTYKSWEAFPPTQKLFATWETIAHLKYLEEKQLISRGESGRKVAFSINFRVESNYPNGNVKN